MSWTYDDTLASDRDRVRFLTGENDPNDPQVSDEEIAFALSYAGTVRAAAIMVAEHLAAKFARLADSEVGDLKISYSQMRDGYIAIADRLRADAAIMGIPQAGGISISRKRTVEEDTDRVVPAFNAGMLKNPRVSTSTDRTQ